MLIVAGLFRDRERALAALRELQESGCGDDVAIVASPTSAGDAASEAARELPRPGGGFVDLGSVLGGQAHPNFPLEERATWEERVAQGDTLLRVNVADHATAERAEAVLLRHGAERVLPGVIRD
jgi:cytosine/adenosine deaminase-related metal-dependent hydrolase